MSATPSASASLASLQDTMNRFATTRQTAVGTPIPKNAVPVSVFGYVVVPAYGAVNQVVICEFTVKANNYLVLDGVAFQFTGSGQAPGPGDLLWTVDVDRPLLALTGFPERDFGAVPFEVGSIVGGPLYPVDWRHFNEQTVRVKITSVANVGTGPGNFVKAVLHGWTWPASGSEGF